MMCKGLCKLMPYGTVSVLTAALRCLAFLNYFNSKDLVPVFGRSCWMLVMVIGRL